MILFGFCNANWGGDLDTRNPPSILHFFWTMSLSLDQAEKQPTMALSNTKVEYMATSQARCEAIWL